MNVLEPKRTENLVRADSVEARNGFRYVDIGDSIHIYFVPMDNNNDHLYIRRSIRDGQSIFIDPDYVLVFNIQRNVAGIVKADRMVEPIDFTVTVKGKK